jgi:DNA-binding MarR family transcriptional regulator
MADDLPDALERRTAYLLTRAAARVNEMGERDLEPLGISTREYGVLAVLAEHSPLSQSRIAAILGLDRTTILKLGASLERKGFLVRQQDADDRRAYAVALTDDGDRVRENAFTLLLDCEERFLEPLTVDERDRFHDLLGRVVEL